MEVEDFDVNTDTKFVNEKLVPYFVDLFKDLSLRSSSANQTEK